MARKSKAIPGGTLTITPNSYHSLKPCQSLLLPAELLHQICSNLTTSEVAAFRLACKSFAAIGKEHLVEELCFFLHPHSIAKVMEIAESDQWAGRVKTLVFEDVRLKELPHIPQENEISPEAGSINLDEVVAIWDEQYGIQQSYRKNNLADLLGHALLQFCNLKSIHSHQGFKDPRPVGPDAKTPLATILQSRKQSLHRLGKRLWDDRASERIWIAGEDGLLSNVASEQLNSHLTSYWDLAKRALKAASDQSDDDALSPALTKLTTLTVQGATDTVLIKLGPQDHLELGNGRIHLVLHCELPRSPGYYLGFDCDVECLSRSRSGFTNLAKCTLMGGKEWPSAWLQLWSLDVYSLSLPNLQELSLIRCRFSRHAAPWLRDQRLHLTLKDVEISKQDLQAFTHGSSLLSVSASGYWVIVGRDGDGGTKVLCIAQSEKDPANTSSSDKELPTWNRGEWLHPGVVETFMVSGGCTNETFGFTKPKDGSTVNILWKDDDENMSDEEKKSSEAELKRYQKLFW